jgi:hypothetical protein
MKLWIARDDYKLALSKTKPRLFLNDIWFADGEVSVVINPDWFPEITKENSPQEVELKLVDNETRK